MPAGEAVVHGGLERGSAAGRPQSWASTVEQQPHLSEAGGGGACAIADFTWQVMRRGSGTHFRGD